MARLRDLKVGMKVQIMKGSGNPDFFTTANIGLSGAVAIIDNNDSLRSVFVKFSKRPSEWYPASWIKIVKDEGETKMAQKVKTKVSAAPQKYILMIGEDISSPFTDISTKGIFSASNHEWALNDYETTDHLKSGEMKIFKIEEVKFELVEPSVKIIG